MIYLFFVIFIILIGLFALVWIAYQKNISVPVLGSFVKSRFLKARFKIWDDLSMLESGKALSKVRIICFKAHKWEANFFRYLTILFQSEKDSFLLLNCDEQSDRCDEKYIPEHKELKKRVSIFSMIGLIILIIANILIAFAVSQIYPSVSGT